LACAKQFSDIGCIVSEGGGENKAKDKFDMTKTLFKIWRMAFWLGFI
jgi:hypothetical protein